MEARWDPGPMEGDGGVVALPPATGAGSSPPSAQPIPAVPLQQAHTSADNVVCTEQ